MSNLVEIMFSFFTWWFDHPMISVPFATVGLMLKTSKFRNVRTRGDQAAAASGLLVEITMFMLLVLRLKDAYVIGSVVTISIGIVVLLVTGVVTLLNWEESKRARRQRALQRDFSRVIGKLQALR